MAGGRIRAVLFDKDGTLIDFKSTWMGAYRGVVTELSERVGHGPALAIELLARLGYHDGADRFEDESPLLWATNPTVAALWAREPELASLGATRVLEIVERHFGDHQRYPPQPVGDVRALMLRLKARGLPLGVATMDNEAKARATIEQLLVTDLIDFVTGSDSGNGVKPGPGMVEAFCRAVAVPADAVMMVGDTHADLLMARNAGCAMAVAVRTGGTPGHVLDAHADHVLDTIHELEGLLG